MPGKPRWTILTYIAAHNNLQAMGDRSLDQIVGVGSSAEVAQAVLFDGPSGAVRCIAGSPGRVREQEQLTDFDSGDPRRLIETAQWAFDRCPAENFALVLWSHGSGWMPHEIEAVAQAAHGATPAAARESIERSGMPGSRVLFRSSLAGMLKPMTAAERAILFDDGTGHSLDTLELGRALSEIRAAIGRPIEFLGMDACLMANLEVAYQIRNAVRFMAASEELVPGHSWPYDVLYADLRCRPEMDGAELSRRVVAHYTDYYTAAPPAAGDVTQVALDLSRVEMLATAVDGLAGVLADRMEAVAEILWQAQLDAMRLETNRKARTPNKFDYHLWDIGSLAFGLAGQANAPAGVRAAAAGVSEALRVGAGPVLAEGHLGKWFDGIGGVSIYLMPSGRHNVSPFYRQTEFAAETRWGEMLAAYHDALS
ncbi:MAG: clostripain-related cysteine peptidase [Desulfobacterales bacterium]|jgi:hypothetical protein|nr:clostripain-related cysteine peptidase [Desulfobacterales bacterium]